MNKLNPLKAALLAASLLALPAAYAATLTKADYTAGKARISADYKSDKAACASLAANAKDICMQEAKAKEKSHALNSNTATPARPPTATRCW